MEIFNPQIMLSATIQMRVFVYRTDPGAGICHH